MMAIRFIEDCRRYSIWEDNLSAYGILANYSKIKKRCIRRANRAGKYKLNRKMVKQVLTFALLTVLFLSSCNNSKNNQANQKDATVIQTETNSIETLLVGHWVEPNPINGKEVQGIEIIKGGNAKSIHMATLLYSKWWIKNNQLFLEEESIGNHTSTIDTTTYDIIKVDKDSLIIKDKLNTIRYKKQ